jgi:hypothetical protein
LFFGGEVVHCGENFLFGEIWKLFSLFKCHFVKFALEMKKLPNFRGHKIGGKRLWP